MRDYLLGLATLPAMAIVAGILWYTALAVIPRTIKALRRLPLSSPMQRARFAAACCSVHRIHLLGVGPVTVAVLFGHTNVARYEQVFEQVYTALGGPPERPPAAPMSRVWIEPSGDIDHSDQDQ